MKLISNSRYHDLINEKNALGQKLNRILWGICDILHENKALESISHGVQTGEVDYATKDRRFRVRFNMYTDLFNGFSVNGYDVTLPELLHKLKRVDEQEKHIKDIVTYLINEGGV